MRKKVNKVLAGILSICFFITTFQSVRIHAVDELADGMQVSKDGFQYQADWSDSNSINVMGYEGEGGKVTIPAKIDGKKVVAVYGFKDNSNITELTISNGIKTIGGEAFVNCTELTKVTIPASVESINYSFTFCASLTEFVVAKKNKAYYTIDGVLMKKNDMGNTLVTYPGGKEGEYTIPKEITYIGEQSFYGAAKITKVTIPSTCKNINSNAFDSCTMLSTVVIAKNGVLSLNWKEFAHCTALTKVTIPSTMVFMAGGPFMGCTSLKTLDINKYNKSLKVVDGMIVSKTANYSGITLYGLLSSVKLTDGVFTVPKDVYSVEEGAFGEIEGLTTIDFSKCKVREFGSYFFEGFAGTTIIIKKGSELAASINNEDIIYLEDGVANVKYVK
jgi:hypothetical protein